MSYSTVKKYVYCKISNPKYFQAYDTLIFVNADYLTVLNRWMKRYTITPTGNQFKTLKRKLVSSYHKAEEHKITDNNISVKIKNNRYCMNKTAVI